MKYLLALTIIGWGLLRQLCLPVQAQSFEKLRESEISINSYELFYPVVAGTLPTDKKYFLKILRDQVAPFFTRNIVEKVRIYSNISDKRLLETEQMLILGRNDLAEKSLIQSNIFLKKAINQAKRAKKEDEVISVPLTILDTISKQEKLLPYLARDEEGSTLSSIEQNYLQIETIKKDANNLLFNYLHPGL